MAAISAVRGVDTRGQVSFQWNSPDFPFKNPDFLLKNVDFIIKTVRGEHHVSTLSLISIIQLLEAPGKFLRDCL